MRPLPLRTKLTLSYAVVLACVFLGLGFAYYHVFARQLDADADSELAERTRAVHSYLRFDRDAPALRYDINDPEQVAFVTDAARYYQVYDARSGVLLMQSDALQPLGVHYTPAEVRAFAERPQTGDVVFDGGRIRLSNTTIATPAGGVFLMQVGLSLNDRDAAVARFRSLLLWSLPVSLVVLLAAGRWMAGRALAPIAGLARTARTIGITNLHRRLPVRGSGDEVDAVATAFNDVVARLCRSVAEMKQFSTAMAHELRTPLAAIRAGLELSLASNASGDERREAILDQLEEVDKLTRLLGQLLTLARAEAGELWVAHAVVDLAKVSRSVVESLEPVAASKRIALSFKGPDGLCIVGDRGWIERLVLNLVDNAIKYTNAGGSIEVAASAENSTARLDVRDTGVGIPSHALARVFDRFYRTDDARSRSVEGVGLGLTLVKWIADKHRAVIDIDSTPGRGSTFTVRMSLAQVLVTLGLLLFGASQAMAQEKSSCRSDLWLSPLVDAVNSDARGNRLCRCGAGNRDRMVGIAHGPVGILAGDAAHTRNPDRRRARDADGDFRAPRVRDRVTLRATQENAARCQGSRATSRTVDMLSLTSSCDGTIVIRCRGEMSGWRKGGENGPSECRDAHMHRSLSVVSQHLRRDGHALLVDWRQARVARTHSNVD